MTIRHWQQFLGHLRTLVGPHDEDSDAKLLERFLCCREEAAFAALVRRHGPLVLGVCRRMLRNEHDAEDAFQAAFLVLARKAGSIRNRKSLSAWLYEVTYHIAARMRAEAARRRVHERQVAVLRREEFAAQARETELAAVLDEELSRLPEKYRRVLVLCGLQGKTHIQAAHELGVAPGSLSRYLHRARELLRERLAGRGFTIPAALFGTLLAPDEPLAAVPPTLVHSTGRAARLIALGQSPTDAAVSVRVEGLAETAIRALSLSRLKMTAALMMLGGVLGGASLIAQPQRAGSVSDGQSVANASGSLWISEAAAAIRKDRFGDPLPPGAVARFGTARFRHDGQPRSLVFSPNGQILAALTDGGGVLWDTRTGREIRLLPQARGSLAIGRLLDFSPDGRMLAGPCGCNHIGLWDAATGKQLHIFAADQTGAGPPSWCQIHSVHFSPDGNYLAIGGDGDGSYILDVATGQVLHHFKKEMLNCPIFSPDSKWIALGVGVASGDRETDEVQLRELRTGKILRRFAERIACWDLVFSPDGKTLAAAGTDRIRIWDTVTGKVRTCIEKKMGHVQNLAFTPDGKTLISGSEGDGKVHVWNAATGEERRQFNSPLGLFSMALSHDGKTIAAGTDYNTVCLWETANGRSLFPEPPGHSATVSAVAYSPDGKLLLSAGENRQAWLWDTSTGNPLQQIRVASARAIVFAPVGRRFALPQFSDQANSGLGKLDVAPDGRRFALLPSSEDCVLVCDVSSGKKLFRIPPDDVREVNALAYSPDGKTLVTAGWKTTGQNQGRCRLSLFDASTGRFLRRFSIPMFGPDCLAFSPDGRLLAIGGGWAPDPIRLWDPARAEEIVGLRGHENHVNSLAFSPDGRTLVSGSTDRTVRLWEVATGKEIAVLKGHGQEVATVAFSPDGRLVASGGVHPVAGSGSHEIRLWDAATGAEIQQFQGHNSGVNSLAFSPDGAHLVSGLRNGTVLVWEVPHVKQRRRRLSADERETLWSDLPQENAGRAYTAIRKLTEDPEQTVVFLRGRLRPTPLPDVKRISQRIEDLNSDQYAVRQAARKELAAYGELAAPLLRGCLAGKPALEIRKHAEDLLAQTKVLHAGEVLQGVRATAILEQIDTLEARRVLERLAQGAPESRLTQAASAALTRLRKR